MNSCQLRPNHLALGSHEDIFIVRALGSGIVVCLYDEALKTGGMAYTLFPDSRKAKESNPEDRLKYVDTALEALLEGLLEKGARLERLWAKVIGGAKIFRFADKLENGDIGKQNIEAARRWLREKAIPIKAEDTGDSFGRTVYFYLKTGKAEISDVNNYKYNL